MKKRYDINHNAFNYVKHQMEQKDQMKVIDKLEKAHDLQVVHQQLNQQADYTKYRHQEKVDQQKEYRDFLDKQNILSTEIKKGHQMSKDEKKMNFTDLQAYKAGDPRLFSLVPGFVNSKMNPLGIPKDEYARRSLDLNGNHITPDKRIGRFDGAISGMGPYQNLNKPFQMSPTMQNQVTNQLTQMNTQMPTMQTQVQTLVTQQDNNPKERLSTIPPRNSATISPPKRRIITEDKYLEFQSTNVSPQIRGSNSQNVFSTRSNHNPIVNPLPINIQNPYLMKEVGRLSIEKQNRLANLGSNILNQ